jgi:hypothetical protein
VSTTELLPGLGTGDWRGGGGSGSPSDDGGSGASGNGSGSSGSSAPVSGNNGSGSGGVAGAGSSSSGGTLGGSSSNGSGSGSGSSSSSGSSSGGSSSGSIDAGGCTYPPGPYGTTAGAIVDPTLTWQGYLPGSSAVATLRASDLFDCDGSKGINALVFDDSAAWCGSCQQEAQDLEGQMTSTWLAQGVSFVTLLGQDESENPATTATASTWQSTYGLAHVAVVADPNMTFVQPSGGLPTNVLVDPRTMTIVSNTEGYGGPDPAVSQLAQKNK